MPLRLGDPAVDCIIICNALHASGWYIVRAWEHSVLGPVKHVPQVGTNNTSRQNGQLQYIELKTV